MVYKKGYVPWWIVQNKPHPTSSPEVRKKMGNAVKKAWENEEYRKHQSIVHKGQHNSIKTEFKKGNKSWITGTHIKTNTGKTHFKKGHVSWNRGKKVPQMTGEKHFAWKDGVSSENEKQRKGLNYKEWQKSVYKKDNYVCQSCEERGGKLEAHHIYAFSKYPEYRFEEWNGQTLCKECHDNLHFWLGKF